MNKEKVMEESLKLVDTSEFVMVGTNGDEGCPNIKAMFKMENEGIKRIWLSTNTSSKRVAQLQKNPKACLYFVNTAEFKGMMLVGEVEVLQDEQSRKRLWREGNEMYYPQGVNDPDYSVLRFTAKQGNYYHGLENLTFDV